jgi:hypothetical protein
MSFALPLPRTAPPRPDAPAYPDTHNRPPEPWACPWPLRSLGSADCGMERLADGRRSWWIRHQVLRGVTPRMLVWWFSHLEGDVVVQGRRINRYRAWHPYDHVHASYARRCPDGSVGPGASIRLREYLGANRAYAVDTLTDIEKLDEEGYVHNPRVHGVSGLVRMEYQFTRVPEGTLYENRLLVGGSRGWRRTLTPLVQRLAFDHAHGVAWLRHNIEEVGLLEHLLPALYRQETGLSE